MMMLLYMHLAHLHFMYVIQLISPYHMIQMRTLLQLQNSIPTYQRDSPAMKDTKTIDFGTLDQPRELKIGLSLSIDEGDRLVQLPQTYLDVFAWSYENMLGLNPSIVQHKLPLLLHAKPVKLMLRRLHPQWSLKVKNDIQRLLYVGFISIVEYVEWLAYVVLDPKKNKKVGFASILETLIRPALRTIFPYLTLICWSIAQPVIHCCPSLMGFLGITIF